MSFLKNIIIIILSSYILGCVEKTTYSGKIITNEDLDLKILNKNELINKFGQPSYIDSLSNKYFYFTEKKKETNFYDNKISRTKDITFDYKPSPYLLTSIVKYQKKNIKLKTLP